MNGLTSDEFSPRFIVQSQIGQSKKITIITINNLAVTNTSFMLQYPMCPLF